MNVLKDRISECCKKLKISSNFAENAFLTDGESNQEYLLTLLENEIRHRGEARISKLLNTAGFPRFYAKGEFKPDEVKFQNGLCYESLVNANLTEPCKNVIMYGGTGTGKTMLSIILGIEACKKGVPVKFFRAAGLINAFSECKNKGCLSSLKKKLNAASVLVLDEFGYIPYDKTGSQLLFDYLSEIHEKKSVILTTNLEFSQWGNVLYDYNMAAALIGRLTHHMELVLFPGENRRLKEANRAIKH